MDFHDIALSIVSLALAGGGLWLRWANAAIYELKSDVKVNTSKDTAQEQLIKDIGIDIKAMSSKIEALTLAMATAGIKVNK